MEENAVQNVLDIEHEHDQVGSVNITDAGIAMIACYAAADAKGLHSLSGNITKELLSKLGGKMPSGVQIEVEDGEVKVYMSIRVLFDACIPETCAEVQEKVRSAIESMTGHRVSQVNIRVADVLPA